MFPITDLFTITTDITILNLFAIAVWFAQTCPPSTVLIRSKFNLFVSIDIPSIRPRYNTSNTSETIALHHAQRWCTDNRPDRRTYAAIQGDFSNSNFVFFLRFYLRPQRSVKTAVLTHVVIKTILCLLHLHFYPISEPTINGL